MRTLLAWAASLLVVGLTAAQRPIRPFDLLIRGGTVVDGTGAPARRADVAVREGRIAAVGNLSGAPARRVLDARGLWIAPGFIDVHAHADGVTVRRPTADNFLQMGVTTIVSGNCGRSVKDVGRHLERLQRGGVSLNYATLIGHGTVREEVMGRANRTPTPDELARMRQSVEAAMRAGAVGMSTGLIYVPGTYAETEELIDLAAVVARYDGVYASHMRNEGNGVLRSIDEALAIAEDAGVRAHLSHLKASGKNNWGRSAAIVERLRRARAAGTQVTGDQYAYDASSTSLDVLFPSAALSVGRQAFAQSLRDDPELRRAMAAHLVRNAERSGFEDLSYARIANAPGHTEWNGLTLKQAAQRASGAATPELQAELALLLMVDADGKRVGMIYHKMSMADVDRIMAEPYIAVAADSGIRVLDGADKPHPRGAGNNPRVLALFVRERGVIDLPMAIRKMTSLPAAVFRLENRGVVAVGAHADLTLFDPERVQDRATYAEPKLPPDGIPFVIVGGTLVIDRGVHTRARPGQVLRGRGVKGSR